MGFQYFPESGYLGWRIVFHCNYEDIIGVSELRVKSFNLLCGYMCSLEYLRSSPAVYLLFVYQTKYS